MTRKRIAKLLDTPSKQVDIMLAVSAIENATKGLSVLDKEIAVSLWRNGITNLEALNDMLIEEAMKENL